MRSLFRVIVPTTSVLALIFTVYLWMLKDFENIRINEVVEILKEINNIDWLNFFALSIIWGFSFFFIKKGLEVFEPLEVAAFRMSIAFFALLPFILYNFKKLKIDRKKWNE